MKGELHLSKNRSSNGLRHHVPIFLLMDDSANENILFSGVATPETAMSINDVTASWVPYHIHTM